jgi:STE24 endopeptidase
MNNKLTTALTVIMLALLVAILSPAAHAQDAAGTVDVFLEVPDGAKAGPNFDVDDATSAYANLLTEEQRERSNAYYEGGYWLQLWGFLDRVHMAMLWKAEHQDAEPPPQ